MFNDAFDVFDLAHVAGDCLDPALGVVTGAGNRFVEVVLVAGADQDLRALRQQRHRRGVADALAAAGDDRDVVLEAQVHGCAPSMLPAKTPDPRRASGSILC